MNSLRRFEGRCLAASASAQQHQASFTCEHLEWTQLPLTSLDGTGRVRLMSDLVIKRPAAASA
jgi:hypothetical protein